MEIQMLITLYRSFQKCVCSGIPQPDLCPDRGIQPGYCSPSHTCLGLRDHDPENFTQHLIMIQFCGNKLSIVVELIDQNNKLKIKTQRGLSAKLVAFRKKRNWNRTLF
jgi:hypothetical protein